MATQSYTVAYGWFSDSGSRTVIARGQPNTILVKSWSFVKTSTGDSYVNASILGPAGDALVANWTATGQIGVYSALWLALSPGLGLLLDYGGTGPLGYVLSGAALPAGPPPGHVETLLEATQLPAPAWGPYRRGP